MADPASGEMIAEKQTSSATYSQENMPDYYRPLESRTVLTGFTGGIALCRAVDYSRKIISLGAGIIPVMTRHAAKLVSPVTMAALTGKKVHMELFSLEDAASIPHIELARSADLFLVMPATANFMAKAASGLADDLLSTVLLAFEGPVLFYPSMNPSMYSNPATESSMRRLRELGYTVVDPDQGKTACGEKGRGRLPSWPAVRQSILKAVTPQTLKGMKILVSAGPTREPLDPVRYISNRSSGRMGYAMAESAATRGADVTLVTGPVSIQAPGVRDICRVETAAQMADAVLGRSAEMDVIVMTAAVADYAPCQACDTKIKKVEDKLTVHLKKTQDILAELVNRRTRNQVIIGFCAETGDLEARTAEKIRNKGADLMVGNDVTMPGAGFDVQTNRVIVVSADGSVETLPMMDKREVAERIWYIVEKQFIRSSVD